MIKDEYIRRATIVRVIDGDTIEVEVDMGFRRKSGEQLRILRADAFEKRGEEKDLGIFVTHYVKQLLPIGTEIVIKSQKDDSFGRWLAEIYYIGKDGNQYNLSDELMKNGLALPFDK